MPVEISRKTLAYFSPARPMRERPKANFRVPQSHSLHIAPSACNRRSVIWAIWRGNEENVSCLNITEADVVSGAYEDIVGDAVADLLDMLQPQPRIFLLYLKCIDDFLGTDEEALLAGLRARFPMLEFAVCHINPVSLEGKIMPGMLLLSRLYGFLKPSEIKDNGINYIGGSVRFHPQCEIHDLFRHLGLGPLRSLITCESIEDYHAMSQSRLTLVTSQAAELAAQEVEKNAGVPFCRCFNRLNPQGIADNYRHIAEFLGKEAPDYTAAIARAYADLAGTRAALGGMSVILASTPGGTFSVARLLLEHGFNLKLIFAGRVFDIDREDYEWLREKHPEVSIERDNSYKHIWGYGLEYESLTLGFEAARMLRTCHYVDFMPDEGFFGFHGLHKVLEMMREAVKTKADWPPQETPGKMPI